MVLARMKKDNWIWSGRQKYEMEEEEEEERIEMKLLEDEFHNSAMVW